MVSAVGSIFGAVYGYLLVVDTRALSGPHFQSSPLFANKDILAFRLARLNVAALLEGEFR